MSRFRENSKALMASLNASLGYLKSSSAMRGFRKKYNNLTALVIVPRGLTSQL